MYAKIFSSMFDGTLATVGPWEAVVTFQQLLILCEPDGTIDMTIDAISRRTTIPIEILKTGIETLEKPDEESRTPDEDGRRIMKLHDERSWGWRIVNYTKYRSFKTPEEKREYMREYMREYRKKSKSGKGMSGKLGHADADADAEDKVGRIARKAKNGTFLTAAPGLDLEAWERWVSYRAEIKKPIKPPSVSAAQKEMAALGSDQMAAVEKSIASGWQGLFAPSGKQKAAPKWV